MEGKRGRSHPDRMAERDLYSHPSMEMRLTALVVGRGKVDADSASIDLMSIHLVEGMVRGVGRVEGDKAKAAGASGVAVHDDLGVDDGALGVVKGSVQGLVRGAPGQVSNEQAASLVRRHGWFV
jgi:hypothetical protein